MEVQKTVGTVDGGKCRWTQRSYMIGKSTNVSCSAAEPYFTIFSTWIKLNVEVWQFCNSLFNVLIIQCKQIFVFLIFVVYCTDENLMTLKFPDLQYFQMVVLTSQMALAWSKTPLNLLNPWNTFVTCSFGSRYSLQHTQMTSGVVPPPVLCLQL